MVKLIGVIILSFFLDNCNQNNHGRYIGKEIDLMISDKEYSNYLEYQFFDLKPRVLSGVRFIYKEKYIEVFINDVEFIKRFNVKGNWDFEEVKKEKISRIVVYNLEDKILFDSNKKK